MTPIQVNRLKRALEDHFDAEVEAERVNAKGRYRFAVVSSRFNKMPHLKRQDAIWEVVDETLSPEASLDISLILAYAPKELATANGAE
jgi:stress-induced morphogen